MNHGFCIMMTFLKSSLSQWANHQPCTIMHKKELSLDSTDVYKNNKNKNVVSWA